jgi:hypothetical protein
MKTSTCVSAVARKRNRNLIINFFFRSAAAGLEQISLLSSEFGEIRQAKA